jgi:tetratricopeptide (TPR) repeat protein
LLPEVTRLVEQIPKAQQKCEGYLGIAREYLKSSQRESCLSALRKVIELGKNLGTAYQSKVWPSVLECLLGLNEYDFALELVEQVQDPLAKISLWCAMVKHYEAQGKTKEFSHLLDRMIPCLKSIEPQYGDQSRMYAFTALYVGKLRGIVAALHLWDKALSSWDAIINTNYKKETISFWVSHLEPLGDDAQLLPLWQKLYTKAQKIDPDVYRFRAVQEIAQGLTRIHQFAGMSKILDTLPPASEARFQVLATYIQEAEEKDRLPLLKIISPEQRVALLKKLSEHLEKKGDIEGMFRLWLEIPDNFALLCGLSTKILAWTLQGGNKDYFSRWFAQIAPAWGLKE